MDTANEDLRETCKICNGKGVSLDSTMLELINPCHVCKGNGKIHWTDNAMGGKSKEDLNSRIKRQCVENNIRVLADGIKYQLSLVGIRASVEIYHEPDHYNRYMHENTKWLNPGHQVTIKETDKIKIMEV